MIMSVIRRKEPFLLFVGDIIVLYASLFLALSIRNGDFPDIEIFNLHLAPFSILFVVSILVNFIFGLYEKHTLIFKNRLPVTLLNVQIINAIIGIAFFYFIPFYSITPKVILFIYITVSLMLMSLWRMFLSPKLGPKRTQRALIVGDTKETEELYEEVNHNSRYHLIFTGILRPSSDAQTTVKEISDYILKNKISLVVIDTRHVKLLNVVPELYNFTLSGVMFFDVSKMYESIFDRVPISLVGKMWFVENMSAVAPKFIYDSLKRSFDIFISLVLGIISIFLYPFIMLIMKIEDKDNVIFTFQPRIGQNNKLINIIKFRTMKIANDNGNTVGNKVTKFGSYMRKLRIDELPQLWNVIKGDLSLIGPRPELPKYVEKYSNEIPYYSLRHSIKPGLSGWAQIYHQEHPHHGVDIEETRNKLSYDLFYIKNRSLLLDLKIALRTIKVLLTFVGR
jgi:exopolysaccharide biosynthesis polyprenyl glycosylphosphotransferase